MIPILLLVYEREAKFGYCKFERLISSESMTVTSGRERSGRLSLKKRDFDVK
jgi:hypothetical protein